MVAVKSDQFKALVVGSGPAGIAAIGKILDLGVHPILWVDQTFTCGRLESYRQVPRFARVGVKLFF
jgi:cation diffusion facilitator CzcD-associated flavoprotein CzcO